MNEPSIRPLREEDRDVLLALMRESLGEGPMGRSPKVWRWKHQTSPFGPSPGLAAESDDEIVGLRLFMPWRWSAGGREVRAVRAVDTATRSDYRGRGIFRRLTTELVERMEDDGVSFVFNTPNSKSRPGYLKMGWSSVGRLRLQMRPTRRMFLHTVLPGERTAIETPGRPVEELLQEPGLPELLERFAKADAARWTTPRTAEFLRWRYAEAPRLGYRALWSFKEEGGAAIILRVRRRGRWTEASLAEILPTPGRAGVRAARRLLREIASSDVDFLLAATASGTPERRAVRGFLPFVVPTRHFTVRLLRSAPHPDPRRWSSWRLSLGDLEVF